MHLYRYICVCCLVGIIMFTHNFKLVDMINYEDRAINIIFQNKAACVLIKAANLERDSPKIIYEHKINGSILC